MIKEIGTTLLDSNRQLRHSTDVKMVSNKMRNKLLWMNEAKLKILLGFDISLKERWPFISFRKAQSLFIHNTIQNHNCISICGSKVLTENKTKTQK